MKHTALSLGALIAGALLPLAFAPYGYAIFALISPFLLLSCWQSASPAQAAWRGWCYGAGFFGVGIYWIFISIHYYGGAGIFLSGSITAGFVALLALFPAVQGYLLQRFFPRPAFSKYVLVFPASWVIMEGLRSILFTGFPWLLIGVSQTHSALRGFIPVTGVYGSGFIVVLAAGLLASIFYTSRRWFSIAAVIIIYALGTALARVSWTTADTPLLPVTLVQGNVGQSLKWVPQQALQTVHRYQRLTAAHWQSRIIVWPETAVPFLWPDAKPLLAPIALQAAQHHSALVTGIPIYQEKQGVTTYFNGVVVLGAGKGQYYKRHLVPFGEYVPLADYLGKLLAILDMPMSMFQAGAPHQPLLTVNGLAVAPFVCYEIAYTDLVRSDLPAAQLLMTLSDDAWFDQSSALGQHLQIAQFAAIAAGRDMLVATNSGETAIINAQGKIVAQAPANITTTLDGQVQGMRGATPWVTIGNTPWIIFSGLLLLGIGYFEMVGRVRIERTTSGLKVRCSTD